MKRRDFITGMAGTAATSALAAGAGPAFAQASGRIYRLGHLANSVVSEAATRDVTLPELARLGFVEGRNLIFEASVGDSAAMPGLMRDVLAAKPDAIIAVGPAAVRAAGDATRTVPIIAFGADPVELGFARNYARPGGNVTGVVILVSELEAKRLSILHEAAPDRRRVAALVSAAQQKISEPALRKTAADLGLELLVFPVETSADYPAAFAAMRKAGAQALVIGAAPELFRDGRQLAALALEAGLPTVCEWAEMAQLGCLIGYGPSRSALRKRVGVQAAMIFGGASVGDVAIEQPTLYEFAINQKSARTLGLTLTQAVLVRADEVIE